MTRAADNLWSLTLTLQQVDPVSLAAALQEPFDRSELDFRTRLLIRDSLSALERLWGREQWTRWIESTSNRESLESIWRSDLGPPGFPSLEQRVMEPARTSDVEQLLRELSQNIHKPTKITIGGSIALLLAGALSRRTEDIDLVDEVPQELRDAHGLLDRVARRYHLQLTHFQSHYLPAGWESRAHSLHKFGELTVFVVDAYDIFVSKLFSAREKDLDDLRALSKTLDKEVIESRIRSSAENLIAEQKFTTDARRNWYIVFGDAFPGQC